MTFLLASDGVDLSEKKLCEKKCRLCVGLTDLSAGRSGECSPLPRRIDAKAASV